MGVVVEDDVELTFLDALVEPGAAEDEAAKPMNKASVRRADELRPVLVDVLAERRAGVGDLSVHRKLEQVVQFFGSEAVIDEVELYGCLLDTLSEVFLVEREAELAVLEHVVRTGLVVPPSSCLFHLSFVLPFLFLPDRECDAAGASLRTRSRPGVTILLLKEGLHKRRRTNWVRRSLKGGARRCGGVVGGMENATQPHSPKLLELEPLGTVVVCEDDEATLELLCDNLTADRYEVIPAPSAADALRHCHYRTPDLLLLDIELPDASGLDVLREIRRAERTTGRYDSQLPVIVLSGRGTENDRTRGLVEGADDYIAKPFYFPELTGAIS